VFIFVSFRGGCYAFLYQLEQLLEHFVTFLSCSRVHFIFAYFTVFNERRNDDDVDDFVMDLYCPAHAHA